MDAAAVMPDMDAAVMPDMHTSTCKLSVCKHMPLPRPIQRCSCAPTQPLVYGLWSKHWGTWDLLSTRTHV